MARDALEEFRRRLRDACERGAAAAPVVRKQAQRVRSWLERSAPPEERDGGDEKGGER